MICEHAASEEPPAAAPQTGDRALTSRETRSGVRAPANTGPVNYVFGIPDALASGASLTSSAGRVLNTANTHLAGPLSPHGPHPRGGLTVRQGGAAPPGRQLATAGGVRAAGPLNLLRRGHHGRPGLLPAPLPRSSEP